MITAPDTQGWWIASDGLWYPPETHPDAVELGAVIGTVIGEVAVPSLEDAVGTVGADAGGAVAVPSLEETPAAWDDALANFAASTLAARPDGTQFAPAPAHTTRRRRGLLAVAAAVVAVLVATTLGVIASVTGPTAPNPSASGWVNRSLHVVGTPVAGDGRVLLLEVGANHQLRLAAVDPAKGSVAWTTPYSPSGITPGVQFGPVIVQNIALDLDPVGNPTDPGVHLKGIDVRTGKVAWSLPQPVEATDPPAACNDDHDFCLPVWDTQTTSALVALDAPDGQPVFVVQGPYRNVSESAPGDTDHGGVWQTSDSAPTFTWVDANGQRTWSATVASLFGGSQYGPDNGYYFALQDGFNIGSVGIAPTGDTTAVGDYKTVAVRSADGSVAWSVPGDFQCGGTLQFLATDLVCRYTGSAQTAGQTTTVSGNLVLRGLDPATGALTWSRTVGQAEALSTGSNVAFADGTHLVVQTPGGSRMVLDTEDGSLAPVSASQAFWCEQNPLYKVDASTDGSVNGQRASAPVFTTCSAGGARVDARPATEPSSVGVRVGGSFVWPSTDGLHAVRTNAAT